MSKYKIGDVARILGLPNDTLRYYESRGLVAPHKDEGTNYRYYDAWDLNYLLDSKWYRSFGFTLDEVAQMINEDDQKAFVDHCMKREAELLHTINDCQQKLKALVAYRYRVSRIKSELGVFEQTDSPPLVYQRHRYKYDFIPGDESLPFAKKWTELMPYVEHTFVVPQSSISREGKQDDYYWGFSLSPGDAIRYGIEIAAPAEYLPPVGSIRTVFSATERGTFMASLRTQVIDKIVEMGHKVNGPPVGHLIVRLHEEGVFKRYFEVWVPIK